MKSALAAAPSSKVTRRAVVAKAGRIAPGKVEVFAREFTPGPKQSVCDAVGELLKLRGRA